jgi:hypothetical protein
VTDECTHKGELRVTFAIIIMTIIIVAMPHHTCIVIFHTLLEPHGFEAQTLVWLSGLPQTR